jgi:hypothetical protein
MGCFFLGSGRRGDSFAAPRRRHGVVRSPDFARPVARLLIYPRGTEVGCDCRENQYDRRDPPNWFDPGPRARFSKFSPKELVVVEILVGQVRRIISLRFLSPAGVVIRSTVGASERTGRNILTANRTHLGCDWANPFFPAHLTRRSEPHVRKNSCRLAHGFEKLRMRCLEIFDRRGQSISRGLKEFRLFLSPACLMS